MIGSSFFGVKSSPYRRNQSAALRELDGVGGEFGGLAGQAGRQRGIFDPLHEGQMRSSIAALRTDPYDQDRRSLELGAIERPAFDAARSRLSADMARRGLSGTGIEAGALGSLAGMEGQSDAGAMRDLALRRIDGRESRRRELDALLGDLTDRLWSRQSGALGAQGQVAGTRAGMWGDMAQQDEARRQAARQMLMQTLMGAGQLYGASQGWGGGRK